MSDEPEEPDEGVPSDLEAQLDPDKLTEYALNSNHTQGRHKAQMFRDALDYGPEDAETLRFQLLDGVYSGNVTGTRETEFGFRYQVEIPIQGNNDQTANVETVWQVEGESSTLRLITVRSIKKDQ